MYCVVEVLNRSWMIAYYCTDYYNVWLKHGHADIDYFEEENQLLIRHALRLFDVLPIIIGM